MSLYCALTLRDFLYCTLGVAIPRYLVSANFEVRIPPSASAKIFVRWTGCDSHWSYTSRLVPQSFSAKDLMMLRCGMKELFCVVGPVRTRTAFGIVNTYLGSIPSNRYILLVRVPSTCPVPMRDFSMSWHPATTLEDLPLIYRFVSILPQKIVGIRYMQASHRQ
jgi:hypothetical protein